jgi:hypothetical protein
MIYSNKLQFSPEGFDIEAKRIAFAQKISMWKQNFVLCIKSKILR